MPVPSRPFQPPLRVTAVLSAAGRDGRAQLQALREAVAGAGIPARLRVISGDEELIDDLAGTEVKAELIAGGPEQLCTQLAGESGEGPHIIHLLCHGRMRAGVATLAFGAIADMDDPNAELGSINVSVAQLVSGLQGVKPWLVVLAACQTGAADEVSGARPFAHQLVHDGLTAAIGMRRLIDLRDTDRFCKLLYPRVMAAIKAVVDPPGRGEQVLDWAATLTGPRQAMSGADPAGADVWTDPVLYVQSEALRISGEAAPGIGGPIGGPNRGPGDGGGPIGGGLAAESVRTPEESAKLQGQLDEYRNFLDRLDDEHTDPAMVAMLEAKIAELERQLRGQEP